MKSRPLRNVANSVRNRLLKLSKEKKEDYLLVLTRYTLERILYRLSCSTHRDQFILKGAMLFSLWSDSPHRATRDMDLLGRGSSDLSYLQQIFAEIIATQVDDDGIVFDHQNIKAVRIKEDQEYEGVRINLIAQIDSARVPIQIDIGFGDAITPQAIETQYPSLLDFPKPLLLSYPQETVIAEKFQAMVALGIGNSRMKDFYDLWLLASKFNYAGEIIAKAINKTFDRRRTQLPADYPLALTEDFYQDANKLAQWQAFANRTRLETSDFYQVISLLREFLMPPTLALVKGEIFNLRWYPEKQWSTE